MTAFTFTRWSLVTYTGYSKLSGARAGAVSNNFILFSLLASQCNIVKYQYYFFAVGAVGLLFISTSVTMTLPYAIGKIIDVIYSSNQDSEKIKETLVPVCQILGVVFLIGAAANFGRVYLIQTSGQ